MSAFGKGVEVEEAEGKRPALVLAVLNRCMIYRRQRTHELSHRKLMLQSLGTADI